MRVRMHYGRDGLPVELPGDWDVTVLVKPATAVFPDPAAAIEQALDNPAGSGRIAQEARGCRSACILVCDATRPVPNGLILPPLLRQVLRAGIDPAAVTILVATGLHRPCEGVELEGVIGDRWVLDTFRIVNHLAREDGEHVDLGTAAGGIPLKLDRRFVQADLRVAVGLVEPHFMAGWSGGRKLVLPGIAHAGTIAAFHAASMIGHPGAGTCRLEGNPLHEAQLDACARLPGILAVNVVIDERRRVSFASFGGIVESHEAAVRAADPHFRVAVPRRFPTVLVSGAGFPLDTTYYQAVKGICAGAAILEPGGELFAVSECAEGLGSADFRACQARLREKGVESFAAEAFARPRAEVDEWETVMLLKGLRQGNVHLYSSGLSAEEMSLACVAPCRDLAGELSRAVERDPARRLAVIPEGPYVAAEVRSAGTG